MSIANLPKNERPRERLLQNGPSVLSNVELLAVIIGSGTKGHSALDIAHDLIKENGMRGLIDIPYKDFKKIKGINNVNSVKLAALIELVKRFQILETDSQEGQIDSIFIYNKYKTLLIGDYQEVMGIIILDKKKRLLHEKILYRGTRHNIQASFKDIFREMVANDGSYFYLFHTHPNSSSEPSDHDVIFTSQLIKESKKFGFYLLDHIIIAKDGYFSFFESDQY